MSDQCQHCIVRGDLEKCLKTECHQHEDWWAIEILKRLEAKDREIEGLKADLDGFIHGGL